MKRESDRGSHGTAPETGLSRAKARRLDSLVYLFILFQGCLYWIFCLHVEDFAPDSSTYQGLAWSLRNFGTYQFNFAPHIQYPPGLPVLLAGVGSVFGEGHLVFLRTMAIAGGLGLWVSYEFLKEEEGRAVAAVGTLLFGASVSFFIFAAIVVNSDIPYLITSIAALVLCKRLEKPLPMVPRLALSVGLGFLIAYSVLLRSAGVALVGGFFIWLALSFVKNRRNSMTLLATFGPPVALAVTAEAAWWWYVRQAKAQALSAWGGTYTDAFRLLDPHNPALGTASLVDILLRIPGNLIQHSARLFEIASGLNWIAQLWYSPFVLIPMALVAGGFFDTVRRRQGPVEWYFLLYAIIYSLWPYDVGIRFVLPVFPIAFLYAWRATGRLLNFALRHPSQFAFPGLVVSVFFCTAPLVAQLHADSQWSLQTRIALLFWATASVAFAAMRFSHLRESVIGFLSRPIPAFHLSASLAQWMGILLLVLVVAKGIVNEGTTGIAFLESNPSDISHSASVDAALWIKAHALESDVVMAQQLAVVHYVSGLRIVEFPATTDSHLIMETIRRRGVKFLVVITSLKGSNLSPRETERMLALNAAYGDVLQLAHADSEYQIFRILSARS